MQICVPKPPQTLPSLCNPKDAYQLDLHKPPQRLRRGRSSSMPPMVRTVAAAVATSMYEPVRLRRARLPREAWAEEGQDTPRKTHIPRQT
jgi:hypothetical protein